MRFGTQSDWIEINLYHNMLISTTGTVNNESMSGHKENQLAIDPHYS
jgi:hypothetical protein